MIILEKNRREISKYLFQEGVGYAKKNIKLAKHPEIDVPNFGPPRFDGDRPSFGDGDGYRGGPRGPPGDFGGEKGGAPADYQPAFRGGMPGFGRGAGGFGAPPPS